MTNLEHKQVYTFIYNCAEKIKMVADAKGALNEDKMTNCWVRVGPRYLVGEKLRLC